MAPPPMVPARSRWPLGLIALLALALAVGQAVLSDRVGNWVRETVLVRNAIPVGGRHLQYATADDASRNAFMLSRGEVEVVVPWDMDGHRLVAHYGLQSLPNAVRAIRDRAGTLDAVLGQGESFVIPLN